MSIETERLFDSIVAMSLKICFARSICSDFLLWPHLIVPIAKKTDIVKLQWNKPGILNGFIPNLGGMD